MKLDVFGIAGGIARLYEFLCYHVYSLLSPHSCKVGGGIALTDVGVYAADKIYILFHYFICLLYQGFFRAMM